MANGAVITADIVNSTLFSPEEEKRFMSRALAIFKPYRFEFYRGDSFQILVKDPFEALKPVLLLRVAARKMSIQYDVRAGIGIGEINPRIRKLSTASDPAFVLSGRAFDSLTSSKQRLAISSPDEKMNYALRVISHFLDYLMQDLTEKQAEVLGELLLDRTQLEAARKYKKSISTINKHAKAAGWDEILKLIDEYRQVISIL